MDERHYLQQAQALLPKGPAWTRARDAVLTRLLSFFANIYAGVDNRATFLAHDANPANSTELLPDWEAVCGLPDECSACAGDTPKTLAERRVDVVNHLTANNSPTIAYFKQVARNMGFEVKIEEMRPFIAGWSRCGDRLNGPHSVRHYLKIHILNESRVVLFRTGAAQIGDKLGTIRYATELECVLNKLKPAHIIIVYSYE